MSLTRIVNIPTQHVAEKLIFLNGGKAQSGALIKAVYVKSRDKWNFLIGKCVLGLEGCEEVLAYREHMFVSKYIDKFNISNFFSDIQSSGFRLFENVSPFKSEDSNINWEENIIPSHYTSTGFPVRRFSAPISRNSHFHESQLVSYGMEFHASAAAFLKRFMSFEEFHQHNDGRTGEISIEISDLRGKISIRDNRLSILGMMNEDFCIVGETHKQKSIILKADASVEFDEHDLKGIELWLLNKENEVIDYRSSTAWPYKYDIPENRANEAEYLKELIRGGESQICEFKLYVRANEKADSKALEIAKTVCAFSNQEGGRLIIGVNNEYEIVGISENVRKEYECDLETAIKRYIVDIQNRLDEVLRDNECFTVRAINLYSFPVIVITVDKVKDINALKNPNDAFIRKGSKNIRMSVDEIRAAGVKSENRLFGRY